MENNKDFQKLRDFSDGIINEIVALMINMNKTNIVLSKPVTGSSRGYECYSITRVHVCDIKEIRIYDNNLCFVTFHRIGCDNDHETSLNAFTADTIVNVLIQLRKDFRAEKLDHLRQIVERAGGIINCDTFFGFHSIVDPDKDSDYVCGEKSFIKHVELGNNDAGPMLYFDCICGGEESEENEFNIPDDEIDELIAYIEKQSLKIDISLTEYQQDAVNRLKTALDLLNERKVIIIEDHFTDGFRFVNGEGIEYENGENSTDEWIDIAPQLNKQEDIVIANMTYFSDDNGIVARKA